MARRIFLLMIAFLSGHAAGAGAEPLGRLFFSPDERAMLDRMRNNTPRSAAASTGQVTLNGLVRRSSGKTTVWINQMPQRGSENPQGITVLKSTARSPVVPLQLPSGKQIRLKPGQTFDTAKGKVHEGYEYVTPTPPPEATK